MPVILRYLYRDGNGFKEFSEAVFPGTLRDGDGERLRRAAEGGEDFVAGQVGLPPLQPRMLAFPSEDDHGFHCLIEGDDPQEVSDDAIGEVPVDPRPWADFLDEFEAAGRLGWDPAGECERLGIDL